MKSFLDLSRYTAYLALAIEVFDAFGRMLKIPWLETNSEHVEKIGLLLFLISLVGWLEGSRKSLAKLERVANELETIADTGKRMDLIGKYGAHATSLARLLYPQNAAERQSAHCRAGGQTLSRLLLETYKEAAKQFDDLRNGDQSHLTLKEHSVINLFLYNLVEALPQKSVWLGISRLQDAGAWRNGSAEASYYDFEKALESKVKRTSLTCLRLLCFQDEARFEQMTPIASKQKENGLMLRSFVRRELPNDMTLIWVPKAQSTKKVDVTDPISFLEANYEPLCGLSFTIRGDREVDDMKLFGSGCDDFSELKLEFSKHWTEGAPY